MGALRIIVAALVLACQAGCTYVWVNAPGAIIAPAVEVSP